MTIAFIHTSPVLVPMFTELAQREMPDVERFHMVDESLIKNTIRDRELTRTTTRRLLSMVESAHEGGADAVLVTCSSIGPAASLAARLFDFPVVRVDEAMAEEAVRTGRRIGVAATLRTTLEPTIALLHEKAAAKGRSVEIVEALCSGAFEAVLAGDHETHDRLLGSTLAGLVSCVDVVVLAQASMARVVAQLPADVDRARIRSSPELAVKRLKEVLFPEREPVLH